MPRRVKIGECGRKWGLKTHFFLKRFGCLGKLRYFCSYSFNEKQINSNYENLNKEYLNIKKQNDNISSELEEQKAIGLNLQKQIMNLKNNPYYSKKRSLDNNNNKY